MDSSLDMRTAAGRRPLLEVCGLDVRYPRPGGAGPSPGEHLAVDRAALKVYRGETLALVGESGSGKTSLALAIPGLLAAAARVQGEVWYRGSDLTKLSNDELREVRGRQIGVVFQDASQALNPVLTIGAQLTEGLVLHRELSVAEAHAHAVELLGRVGFSRPATWMDAWPHQLSGGMRQRAMIAMAVAPGPRLLIADEPTAALDAAVQVQILELLHGLCEERKLALLLVSHSLGLVASWADRVAVMLDGRIVERGPVADVFRDPLHPYTRALFASEPGRTPVGERLPTLPPRGEEPLVGGCFFRARCAHVRDACGGEDPRLEGPSKRNEHAAACLFPGVEADVIARPPGTDGGGA